MRIGVLGINYKSSDVSLREIFAKACQRIFTGSKWELFSINPVLLSTCNRTEMYFSSRDLAGAHSTLLQFLREEIPFGFEDRLYSMFGEECFNHLARVTSGLDSSILAETEIQQQVKKAYTVASSLFLLPSPIHFLFQKCLKIGKEVRSTFCTLRIVPTLENVIFQVCNSLFPDLREKKILFVGNSQINRKIISFFSKKMMKDMTLCTRWPASSERFAREYSLKLAGRSILSSWDQFSMVIFGSLEQDYLLRGEELENINMEENKVLLDLSIPRNVDPALARHPNITLLNIDQLSDLLGKRQDKYQQEAQQSEDLVRWLVEKQIAIFQEKESFKTPHFQGNVEMV
ncbi:MAG: glutamyl-tRNA reductase [Chlamydiae bacterium]|jgi:glutamyl-tRNA reductase|nr:glutamyl-tRNA reductase [Chlamydiota bacterium]